MSNLQKRSCILQEKARVHCRSRSLRGILTKNFGNSERKSTFKRLIEAD